MLLGRYYRNLIRKTFMPANMITTGETAAELASNIEAEKHQHAVI